MNRWKILLIIGVLLALSLPMMVGVAQDAENTLIGAFDVGPGGAPAVIPYMDSAGRTWLSKIWSPLVSWNADVSALEPQLATEWSANDDYTVWTFKLREGVLWHDGEPVTAADVVFSLNLATNPEAATNFPGFSQLSPDTVKEVRAVDDMTVEFELNAPNPRLPFNLILLWILPEHALADMAPADYQSSDWFFTEAIGTGPFMHEEFVRDQFWALVPNPNYWRGAPKLDRLINRYFADETSAILALEAGEIHFTYASGDVAQGFVDNASYEIFDGPSGVTNYMIFNERDPRFADVRVRQAFLYAIDRVAITETVLNATAQVVPCIGAFPTMYPPAEELNDYAYNPDMARQLLAESGADFSQPVEVVTYYDSQFHSDALAAIQAFLADVGVTITPIKQDVPTYNSYFYTGDGWAISYRGVGSGLANFPFPFYEAGGQPTTDGAPLSGGTYQDMIDLLAAARVEGDPDAYVGLIQDVCRFQNQNATEGYMWTAVRFGVASSDLEDFYWFPGPGGGPYEDHAELWTVGG
ncbi:MAG: ABC transporter substrate-binding protein [Chloroflexi bacterium]|nr:ABC transporter substrate-binding protein [Chloroflexota bacterium]